MSDGLSAEMTVRRPEFTLDVSLEVAAGEVLAVLGPNGAGKSTLLGVLAGLLRPDAGRVELAGRVLTDIRPDGRARVHVPPHRRGVGLLAQQALLFPHLSAAANVAFGPRCAGVGCVEADEIAHRWLAEVDVGELARRRPSQLSGGQAQRVALARALAAGPNLLLLDEPLSALDVNSAPAMRTLLRRVVRGSGQTGGGQTGGGQTTVLVTHHLLDALVLADRVLVLDGGQVVEQGPTLAVLTRPRSAFAARLAGLNMVPGTATVSGLRTAEGTELIATGLIATGLIATGLIATGSAGGGSAAESTAVGQPAVAVFAPAAVAVHPDPPAGSPRNVISDVVLALEPQGALVRVRGAAGLAADVTPGSVVELGLRPGSAVWFVVKATEIAVYPTHTAPVHQPAIPAHHT